MFRDSVFANRGANVLKFLEEPRRPWRRTMGGVEALTGVGEGNRVYVNGGGAGPGVNGRIGIRLRRKVRRRMIRGTMKERLKLWRNRLMRNK